MGNSDNSNREFDWDEVLTKVHIRGRETNDKRKVEDIVYCQEMDFSLRAFGVERLVSAVLFVQIVKDCEKGYRFWDALGMWIEAIKQNIWSEKDREWLKLIAQKYLEEEMSAN